MLALAFDFETYPIAPGLQFPPPICMSYAWIDVYPRLAADGTAGRIESADVLPWRDGLRMLRWTLEQGEHHLIGANTAFDVFVHVYADENPEQALGLWTWAIDRGRVHDVLIRQGLKERAFGEYFKAYDLASVVKRTLGAEMDKDPAIRLGYGALDGVPIAQYTPRQREYSLQDSVKAGEVFLVQEAARLRGSPYFPGHDIFANESEQVDGALAIRDLAGYGLRANPRSVARFKALNTAERDALRAELYTEGLVYLDFDKDWEAIAARAEALGKPLARTKTGRVTTARAKLLATGDALIASVLQWPASAPALAANGLAVQSWHKNTEAAATRLVAAFKARGLDIPMTTPARRKKTETAEGYARRVANFEPSVKLDGDACERAGDPLLAKYARLSSLDTVLGSPTEMAETAAREPFHAHYHVLQATGRTATGSDGEGAKGNAQNMHRKPGVREQYEPRTRTAFPVLFAALDAAKSGPFGDVIDTEDRVYVDADYSSGELYTFAQICKWLLGWSSLGDKLLDGTDAHLEIAADIEGISYAEAKARKKEPRISESRTGGKGINFGRKGAMGAKRFVGYAWNSYGIDLATTFDRMFPNDTRALSDGEKALIAAQRLIDLHDTRTPEFPLYSEKVQGFRRDRQRDSKFDLVHPYSLRCVAGLGYSDVHNYPFQGLLSDVGKEALALVLRARWGLLELGHADPLYRCGDVLFAHDSITVEVVRSKGLAAAARLSELMGRASRTVCPDYPTPAEAGIQAQMSKKAEPLVVDGELRVWDAWDQCFQAGRKLQKDGKNVVEGLAQQLWPEYVIQDVLPRLLAA